MTQGLSRTGVAVDPAPGFSGSPCVPFAAETPLPARPSASTWSPSLIPPLSPRGEAAGESTPVRVLLAVVEEALARLAAQELGG